MDTFTVATGLASLVSLAIQMFDIFPKFARFRIPAFLFLFGVFIGSFLHAFDSSSIKLSFQVTGFTIIIAIIATVVIGFLVAAAFSSAAEIRNEFYSISSIGFIVFILFLIFGSNSFRSPDEIQRDQLSISELNTLSERALQNNDFERAIMHLHTIESRLKVGVDDSRIKLIDERIHQIESQELK